ncbi:MAG: hypothetical protein AABX13_00850 [Nanoarchaeota archaeon]
MRLEKHLESLQEVLDEVNTALADPRGIASHQRRLALVLSLGVCDLFSIYFQKLQIMKSGASIKHDWFKQKRIKEKLEQQVIAPLETVKNIELLLKLGSAVERSRDDLAYGSPVSEEKLLQEKMNQFLEMKRMIENEIGKLC